MRGRSAFTPIVLLLALTFSRSPHFNGCTFQVQSVPRLERRGVIFLPQSDRQLSGLTLGSCSRLDRSVTSLRVLTGSKEVDLALGGSVVAAFAFLAKLALDKSQERVAQTQATVKLAVKITATAPELSRMGNFRKSVAGAGYQRRVLLCLGNRKFCQDSLDAAAQHAQAMFEAQFMLVPVPLGQAGKIDKSAVDELSAATKAPWDNLYRTLAFPKMTGDTSDWEKFIEIEMKDQDASQGCLLVVPPDGPLDEPRRGMPDWRKMAADVKLDAEKLEVI